MKDTQVYYLFLTEKSYEIYLQSVEKLEESNSYDFLPYVMKNNILSYEFSILSAEYKYMALISEGEYVILKSNLSIKIRETFEPLIGNF